MNTLGLLYNWNDPQDEAIYSSHLRKSELESLPKSGRENHLGFETQSPYPESFSWNLDK
jgi:hypothetical protein